MMRDTIQGHALPNAAVLGHDEVGGDEVSVGVPPVDHRGCIRFAFGVVQHDVLLVLGFFGPVVEAFAEIFCDGDVGDGGWLSARCFAGVAPGVGSNRPSARGHLGLVLIVCRLGEIANGLDLYLLRFRLGYFIRLGSLIGCIGAPKEQG